MIGFPSDRVCACVLVCVCIERRGGVQETRAELMRKTAVFLLALPTNQVSRLKVPLLHNSQEVSVVFSVETVEETSGHCKYCQLLPVCQRFCHYRECGQREGRCSGNKFVFCPLLISIQTSFVTDWLESKQHYSAFRASAPGYLCTLYVFVWNLYIYWQFNI